MRTAITLAIAALMLMLGYMIGVTNTMCAGHICRG